MRMFKLPPSSLLFIIVCFLWVFVPKLFSIPEYIFPSLDVVLREAWFVRIQLLNHTLTTTSEAIVGCIIGVSVGFLIGVFLSLSKLIKESLLPYIVGSNAVPVVAIAPLIVLWFGSGFLSKALVAAFLSFFPMAINTFEGVANYPKKYRELFASYGAFRYEFFFMYQLPNARPFILSGLKLSATYSVIGAVVAEFLGSDRGLGYGMLQASYSLNTPRLFVFLITSCILGYSMYKIVETWEMKYRY